MSNQNLELSASQQAIAGGDADRSENVAGALEALLLLAAEPVTEFELAQAVGVPESVVAEQLAELVAFYSEPGRGFELRQVGGGWRYYTAGVRRPDHPVCRGGPQSKLRRLPWRRWQWSPTPSRSPAAGFASEGSMSTE